MEKLADFKATLSADKPGEGWPAPLKSLWYDAKGDWDKAHAQVDQLGDAAAAWVHAYLHRKEGDPGNAGYWYRRAGKTMPAIALTDEWAQLVSHFLE